jgi:PAS domain S-box-containing protein
VAPLVPDGEDDPNPLEQALVGGVPQRVGWFRFYFDTERWEWSPEVERMHGYEVGTVEPTTELVLSHKHPDDREKVAATLEEILATRQPFSTRHRIIDTHGTEHSVVVVGDLFHDDADTVVGTHGFYIDISDSEDRSTQEAISEAVEEIAENRAVIEQAKGMLMMVYGVNEDLAFQLLRWRSQDTNTKLRPLAQRLIDEFVALGKEQGLQPRPVYDATIMTVHQRMDSDT